MDGETPEISRKSLILPHDKIYTEYKQSVLRKAKSQPDQGAGITLISTLKALGSSDQKYDLLKSAYLKEYGDGTENMDVVANKITEEHREYFIRQNFDTEKNQRELIFFMDDILVYKNIRDIFNSYRKSKKYVEKARERKSNNPSDVKNCTKFYEKAIRSLPVNGYLRLLIRHRDNFYEEKDAFETRLPKYRARFLKYINRAVKKGTLSVNLNELEKTVNEIEVRFVDPIFLSAETLGHYNSDELNIKLRGYLREEQEEAVFFHEVVHAIAGSTILNEGDKFTTSRSGLRTSHQDKDNYKTHYKWLDEAVTEHLAQTIHSSGQYNARLTDSLQQAEFSNEKWGVYQDVRTLFLLLCGQGKSQIPESLFFSAYFENGVKDNQGKITYPARRKMIETINRTYDKGFLRGLDKYVQKNGVQKAIEAIKVDWRQILIDSKDEISNAIKD